MPIFPIRRAPAAAHRLPEGLRVYAVGDVHGRADCLAGMEERIARDLADRPASGEALVLFLGDYIDRGPDSAAVIERLAARRFAGLSTRCLMGNHEDALLHFLADPVGAADWLNWGGRATLTSYGVEPVDGSDAAGLRRLAADLGEAMPVGHLAFLRELELWIELGGFLFVHAGIRPGVPPDLQAPADLLTIRQPFLSRRRGGPHRVVHGHTIADDVELLPHRIGVDTGAYATGRLSAVVIEGETVAVLP